MDCDYIVIMGTFRTGSTFLSKALSAHKNIAVASDPYFMFFKSFRNEVFIREGVKNFDLESPVSDNFFSKHVELNGKIRNYNLKIPIKHISLKAILSLIGKSAERDSPKVVPLLGDVTANHYDELYRKLLELVHRAYGDENSKLIGFKCTFAEQFLEVLINTFPNIKCIYLLRDPRGVAASQKVFFETNKQYSGRGRYPLYYVIRHWRKSFAYLLDNVDKKENVLYIRYEDLITNPSDSFTNICAFLKLEYDQNMVDGNMYKDGYENSWMQNSSYGTSGCINTAYIDKWKEILTEREIQFIEDLCCPELEVLGYQRVSKDRIMASCLNPPQEEFHKIDPWITSYLDDYVMDERKAEKELIRRFLMNGNFEYNGLEAELLDKIYIGKNYLKNLSSFESI